MLMINIWYIILYFLMFLPLMKLPSIFVIYFNIVYNWNIIYERKCGDHKCTH